MVDFGSECVKMPTVNLTPFAESATVLKTNKINLPSDNKAYIVEDNL
jgi:hypothetical protein